MVPADKKTRRMDKEENFCKKTKKEIIMLKQKKEEMLKNLL